MDKIITSCYYNRPNCTRQMLQYLSKCDHVQDYTLICYLEPGFPEVLAEIEAYPHKKEIFVNDKLLGCWTNKKQAVTKGFELSDYVIHIEDDVLLSKDALYFFDWCRNHYKDDESVFSVTAFTKICRQDYQNICCNYCRQPTLHHEVQRRQSYTSIAWGMWQDRWEEIKEIWNGQDEQLHLIYRKNRYEVFPALSRANHIGFGNGIRSCNSLRASVCKFLKKQDVISKELLTNVKGREWIKLDDDNVKSRQSPDFYKKHYYLDFWADSIDIPNVGFSDVGNIR